MLNLVNGNLMLFPRPDLIKYLLYLPNLIYKKKN